MQEAIKNVVATLTQKLASQLEAIYLFGSVLDGTYQSGESDVNLWLVTADSHNIHDFRAVIQPIWHEYGDILQHAPWISPRFAFLRHIELNPLLAYHLVESGRQIFGEVNLLTDLPTSTRHEMYAYMVAELTQASAALAPNMLEENVAEARLLQLQRLGRRLLGKEAVEGTTTTTLFARLQAWLQQKTADLPSDQPWTKKVPPDVTLPGLQAIYRESGHVVMVFADLVPKMIESNEWMGLGEDLSGEYKGMRVVTADHLRLMIQYNTPLDLKLRRYEHQWGLDPLAELEVETWRVLRTAANIPSYTRTIPFPHAYFTNSDDKINKVIHDFQNRMLNIQLEHELLCRLEHIQRFTTPEPLPGPDVPQLERITSIFQHFDWWSNYYTQKMREAR
jgi:hypothetical protein